MRRGNILEGIKAGFQAYMQGRQFGAQMDYGKLQQEQMAMTARMREQQAGWAMSPEEEMEMKARYGREATDYRIGEQEKLAGREREAGYGTWERKETWLREHPMLTAGDGGMPSKEIFAYREALMELGANERIKVDVLSLPGEVQTAAMQAIAGGDYGSAQGLILGYGMLNELAWVRDLAMSDDEAIQQKLAEMVERVTTAAAQGWSREQISNEILAEYQKELFPGGGFGGWGMPIMNVLRNVPFPGSPFGAGKTGGGGAGAIPGGVKNIGKFLFPSPQNKKSNE